MKKGIMESLKYELCERMEHEKGYNLILISNICPHIHPNEITENVYYNEHFDCSKPKEKNLRFRKVRTD